MKQCILMLLLSLAFTSCDNNRNALLMDKAESMLHNNPDSSYLYLRQINPDILKSKQLCARYALLMSAALDKNYIDVTSDSLTSIAVQYYSNHQNREYEMLAWYYHGLVLMNAQSYPSSIVALEKAERLAEQLNDIYQLGLISRNKAKVFSLTNNNPAAIINRKQAVSYFELAEKDLYKAYSELDLAIDYFNNKDFDLADSLLNYIRDKYGHPILNDYCNIHQASILVEKHQDPEKALTLYLSSPQKRYGLLDYAYLASAYFAAGQKDSAETWYKRGYQRAQCLADSATLDYSLSRMRYRSGDYAEAFRLVDRAAAVQDSVTRKLLQQSVSAAQRDYFKNETIQQKDKIDLMRGRAAIVGIIVLLTLAFMAALFSVRSKEKDRQFEEQMARIALEEQELKKISKDNAHLIGTLFSERISNLDNLARDYFRLEDPKQKDLIYKEVKSSLASLHKDDLLFQTLEKDLDRYCNGVMSKLRTQVPKIKGANLKIISLFFAGYSYETIQLLLNKLSIGSLKTAKSRIRKEIMDANAPDCAFFLDMLEMKKRP